MDLGLLLGGSSPFGLERLISASLSLGSALHLRLPPDAPSRAPRRPPRSPVPPPAPLSRWSGFASIRQPQRTFTSISVSILVARLRRAVRGVPKAAESPSAASAPTT